MKITKYDFWKYLNDKDANYFDGVALVEKVSPNEPLLSLLKNGATIVNRLFLKKVMERIYAEFPTQQQIIVAALTKQQQLVNASAKRQDKKGEKEASKQLDNSDFHRIAEKELAACYVKRRQLSNSFHDCKTDAERASVSDAIKDKIQEINELKTRISVFKETGIMPQKSTAKEFEIPESDADLVLAIQNFRAKVSAQKRLLKDYDSQNRKNSKEEHQLKLVEYQNQLKKLEDEREKRSRI